MLETIYDPADPTSPRLQPAFAPTLFGALELVTAPATQPISRDEARLFCRLPDEIHDDDTVIDSLIDAATRYCQQSIPGHRQFVTAQYDLPVMDWWNGVLRLPRPPLVTVDSVKYYDTNGTQQTLATSNYLVRTPFRAQGTLERAPFTYWPVFQGDRRLPITVRFTCGYGAASAVPESIKQAIRMLVAHWYETRKAAGPSTTAVSSAVAFSVQALLDCESWGSYS